MGDSPTPGHRLIVVGTTGSGKTTLARALGERLGLPHIELDGLHWRAGWQPAPRAEFRAETAAALSRDAWVTDGNYSAVRDIVWQRADTLVWLDYRLSLILWRLLKRSLRRITRQEALWHGNRESYRRQFLSTDSLFLWALRSYGRRRRDYPRLLAQPENAHLRTFHFRAPQETKRWLATLDPA